MRGIFCILTQPKYECKFRKRRKYTNTIIRTIVAIKASLMRADGITNIEKYNVTAYKT